MRSLPVLCLILLVGCPVEEAAPPPATQLDVGDSTLSWAGEITLSWDGVDVLRALEAYAELDAIGGRRLLIDGGQPELREVSGGLGAATQVVWTRPGSADEPELRWELTGHESGWVAELVLRNTTNAPVLLAKASPLTASRSDGALLPGADPARLRILDNGSWNLLDFVVGVEPGTVEPEGFGEVLPGDLQGHSVSNWNHAVADLDGGVGWVAGALTTRASMPVFQLSSRPPLGQPDSGFTFFSATSVYQPHAKSIAPGESFRSERVWFRPSPDPAEGLEAYAEAVHDDRDLVLWTERGHRTPNGWNSWSGSGSTGGYGTGIDQDLIVQNLDVMANELRDWGMDWFQIDDGYEPAYGDWWWREDRFPDGPAWLSQQIRDRGLRPGLWMAPFTLDPESQTALAHPDWIAERTPLGTVAGSGYDVLDLTNPEVLLWIRERMTELTVDWGFDWLKMDFAYFALFGDGFAVPNATREEAWTGALEVIREVLGDDRYFMGVGVTGLNYGLCDTFRLTLDSMPVWDHQPEDDPNDPLTQQGLKPTVRTAGRRWYLQDRVWTNHPDLIFFRSSPDPSWPPLTFTEARAFATFVGLSGGIVKLGDRLVDLQPDALNVLRQLLPAWPRSSRPLDVFEREFPELWHGRVDAPLDGVAGGWDLLGLFHWGANRDLTTTPYSPIPDSAEARSFVVDPAALGLDGPVLAYEFWTGGFLGEGSGPWTVDVPSHDARVVSLRPRPDHPTFLGWNRQISQGGTLLERVDWDDGVLRIGFAGAVDTDFAPFRWEVALWRPEGFAFVGVEGDGVEDLVVQQDGAVVRASFDVAATGPVELRASFE